MKAAWHRFLAPLTPGVRILLATLTVMYVAAVFGIYTRTYNLYRPLALDGLNFWHGQLWRLLSYPLLPATTLDFLWNWLFLLFLGSWLERNWSRSQFWTYCLVSAAGAGLAKVIIQPASPMPMVGTAPIVFGLLAAWGRLFALEKVLFFFIWDMTVRQAAILCGVISFVAMLPCAGLVNSGIALCGGVAGWLYLWTQQKLRFARRSRSVASERMGRLEL